MNGRRNSTRTAAISISAFLLMGILVEPSVGQLGPPKIALLNPSGFAEAGERGVIVSDAVPDAGPGAESALPGYRLSVWVSNAPPGSSVFFAIAQRTIDIEITGRSDMQGSTWEANWQIPEEILDGAATISAYLVIGDEAVAVASQDVTIMRVQENVQLAYPETAGVFGSYAPLADALPEKGSAKRDVPAGVVDAPFTATPDISYVRSFYTTSAPGSVPVWKPCGTETATRAENGVRCALAQGVDQTAITAMAAVANDSPDEYEDRFNQSGDAVAIAEPYAQQLTDLSLVTNGDQEVAKEPLSGRFYCSSAETAKLTDQVGRQIAGANADVHATGPNDQLRFDTFAILTINKPPDRGTHAVEPGIDCTGQSTSIPTSPPGNANPDEQGEHQRFGLPDRKHIETLAGGTSDIGTFSFRMQSSAVGITEYTLWIDETDDGCGANDDAFTDGEFSVSGSIGWAESTSSATPQPFDALVPCGTPVPEPEPTGPVERDGSRSVTLKVTGDPLVLGRQADFTGRIKAAESACQGAQRVVLKGRRPGQKFWTMGRGVTDASGRFKISRKVRAPRDYRVVVPAAAFCARTRSDAVKLRKS